MCTCKAPRARPAANRPSAQRTTVPVGVPTASAMPAPARKCTEACLLAQTLLQSATLRACAGCTAKKRATRCPALCIRGSQTPPTLSPAPCNPTPLSGVTPPSGETDRKIQVQKCEKCEKCETYQKYKIYQTYQETQETLTHVT